MLQSGTKSAMSAMSFFCKTCQVPINKKCLGLKLSEICDIKNSKTETHWEHQTCMSDFHLH